MTDNIDMDNCKVCKELSNIGHKYWDGDPEILLKVVRHVQDLHIIVGRVKERV